jgi:hypothetical protein
MAVSGEVGEPTEIYGLAQFSGAFRRRRDLVAGKLSGTDGVHRDLPPGAFHPSTRGSKQNTPDELPDRAKPWPRTMPRVLVLVLVPTACPQFSACRHRGSAESRRRDLRQSRIRAAGGTMRQVFRTLREEGGIRSVGPLLPSVKGTIDLQGDATMRAVEAGFPG